MKKITAGSECGKFRLELEFIQRSRAVLLPCLRIEEDK